jgi:hypothetical protein
MLACVSHKRKKAYSSQGIHFVKRGTSIKGNKETEKLRRQWKSTPHINEVK